MPKEKEKENERIDADVIIVTEPIQIESGKHTGTITNVVRNLPNPDEGRTFDYLDIFIKVSDHPKEPEIRAGFPTNISELSSLGRLLKKAGMDFSEGDEITISDIKSLLFNKNINFLTKTDKTEQGEFAKVLRDTIEFE
ncbi:MAG: hypothetical protein ACFFDN_02660 [Candidatus Hodarchaeota archaeon]